MNELEIAASDAALQHSRRYMVPVATPAEDCSICQEPWGEPNDDGVIDTAVRLTRGHVFDRVCVSQWLSPERRTCPLCRQDVYSNPAQQPAAHFQVPVWVAALLASFRFATEDCTFVLLTFSPDNEKRSGRKRGSWCEA